PGLCLISRIQLRNSWGRGCIVWVSKRGSYRITAFLGVGNRLLLINGLLILFAYSLDRKLLQSLCLLKDDLAFDWHKGGMAKLKHGTQHFVPAARTAQNREIDASIGDDQAISNQDTAPATKPNATTYYYRACG
ncbi:MAG TPA: hypothetical protein VEN79_18785, partial [Terriglobia bacterium]|nr:hypothetical protein [Terriglobia bacterium]